MVFMMGNFAARLLAGRESDEVPFHRQACLLGEFEAGDFVVDEFKRERFFQQLREWRLDGWSVHIFCNNEGEIERLREIIPAVLRQLRDQDYYIRRELPPGAAGRTLASDDGDDGVRVPVGQIASGVRDAELARNRQWQSHRQSGNRDR